METFTERLNRLVDAKREQGISVLAIARRAQLGGTTLRKLISGDSLKPDIATAKKLAKALGVSQDYLLDGKEKKGPESLEQLTGMMEAYIEAEVKRRVAEQIASLLADTTPAIPEENMVMLRRLWEQRVAEWKVDAPLPARAGKP